MKPDPEAEHSSVMAAGAAHRAAPAPALGHRYPARLRLAAASSPRRLAVIPIGVAPLGEPILIGLAVDDGRLHVHVLGPTGAGKSTLLLIWCLSQVRAGRGLVLFDPWGDLARNLLARLPSWAADRLVLIDPDEREAPPALNLLDLGDDPEAVTDQVVGVMAKVWAQYWGPRTDDLARHAVLTLAHNPGATLADIPTLLTDTSYRRRAVRAARAHPGTVAGPTLEGFWNHYDTCGTAQQANQAGPLLARLRAVLSRRFAAGLLGTAASTFRLDDILNGGILIARLPKGVLGDDTMRLVGSLLLAALWQTAGKRADLPDHQRLDTALVLDECHNFLNLPIGIDHALAEARGLRLSLVLAHQHLGQLTRSAFESIDANARNKIYFSLSPRDAKELERHVQPYFTADDLTDRDAYGIVCRLMRAGRKIQPFSLDTRPAPPPIPGREQAMRRAARARGLPVEAREALAEARLSGADPNQPSEAVSDDRRDKTGGPEPLPPPNAA